MVSHSFLEAIDRITSYEYTPSDEDIAHVRSRKVIQEYKINLIKSQWSLYDITTPGTGKDVWMPYLEGLEIIAFCK